MTGGSRMRKVKNDLMRNADRERRFCFKQFDVLNDRCGMKVGTDGVLIGAWAFGGVPSDASGSMLDVGTGSGLIALMMAQRFPRLTVTGIDIDDDALVEAGINFSQSLWSDRLEVLKVDFCIMAEGATSGSYDFIVSNPPFFANGALSPDEARRTARHVGSLNFSSFVSGASKLLKPGGRMALVAPYDELAGIMFEASLRGLQCVRQCAVGTVRRKPFRRILLEFTNGTDNGSSATEEDMQLYIHDDGGDFSAGYRELTKDFYLKF